MISFLLFVSGLCIGLSFRKTVLLTNQVDVKLKVDSKKAIQDMREAQEAIRDLKKEMEW